MPTAFVSPGRRQLVVADALQQDGPSSRLFIFLAPDLTAAFAFLAILPSSLPAPLFCFTPGPLQSNQCY